MNEWKLRWAAVAVVGIVLAVGVAGAAAYEPIRVGFLWHMHQPIYYPYESVIATDANSRFSYSVTDIHNQRFGPYTTWPRDAVQAGLGLAHLGAQVSFTGSLIENLNNLEAAGTNGGMWNNWDSGYDQGIALTTSLGNPRLDMVAFGYHHPLMPLLDEQDIRMQIKLHKHAYSQTWNGGPAYSNGMFPAETAFSERMIPALAAEGIQWVLVDNIHFDRACVNYPQTNASGLFAPNRADQLNPDPAASGGAWVQLNNVWAPSQVSAPFGYQPHRIQYVNPSTGAITSMIAIPAARYEGNEDGRGGYGAFLYETVMDGYIAYNTDAAHPMFVVLHHDGDNYGGGTDSYYHYNFQQMVAWATGNADYDVTTVEDYLDRFPPATSDVIHVEDGAWAGANNGDAQFKKWMGDPDTGGWSPDYNSWAVLTAAKNRVFTAEAIAAAANMQNVLNGTGTNTEKAWHWLLVSEASDYWYWDGTEIWDSNVTRGCNQAVVFADAVISGHADTTSPTVFLPQRDPYNPGGYEWSTSPEASDFEVWTFAYDVSGLTSVTLKWRADLDGNNPISSTQNETFAGGTEVGPWQSVAMSASQLPAPQNGVLAATYRASRYSGMVTGQTNVLIDYYVEAVDGQGNVARSAIQHVCVGQTSTPPTGDVVTTDPNTILAGHNVTISYNPSGRALSGASQVYLHYGFNTWNPVISPDPAMTWNATAARWQVTVTVPSTASQLDLVFNNGSGTWDNNSGADWHFAVSGTVQAWVMDGVLDSGTTLIAQNGTRTLYAGLHDTTLYVAAPVAVSGEDHFIFIASPPGALQAAPWAKAGQVAAWSAYLANESTNNWKGWFDLGSGVTAQSAAGSSGGVLEGTIDLAQELGALPAVVYVAFAAYATSDGGALIASAQVPVSINGDGNVDAPEYGQFWVDLTGDMNCDGVLSYADINPFVLALSSQAGYEAQYPSCNFLNADCNDDGVVSYADINPFIALLSGRG